MNAELPSFKNGGHNPESASAIDQSITLINRMTKCPSKKCNILRMRSTNTYPVIF